MMMTSSLRDLGCCKNMAVDFRVSDANLAELVLQCFYQSNHELTMSCWNGLTLTSILNENDVDECSDGNAYYEDENCNANADAYVGCSSSNWLLIENIATGCLNRDDSCA